MRKQALNFLYYYFLVVARNLANIGEDELADEHAEQERLRRRAFESFAQDELIFASAVTSLVSTVGHAYSSSTYAVEGGLSRTMRTTIV